MPSFMRISFLLHIDFAQVRNLGRIKQNVYFLFFCAAPTMTIEHERTEYTEIQT